MTDPSLSPPYAKLTTLFLDVGNTLISMDFEWIRAELAKCGIQVDVADVVRAEAAARPRMSAILAAGGGHAEGEAQSLFAVYFGVVLEQLELRVGQLAVPSPELNERLVPVLRAPGETARLWSTVLPGVPAALEKLRAIGLQLAVVSNSDGTVESILVEQGLRHQLDAVFDSTVVGFEKPDPRIFQVALEHTGAQPEETLHVGDLYHSDVVGARSAGVEAVLLDPFGDWHGVDCARVADLSTLAEKVAAARRAG